MSAGRDVRDGIVRWINGDETVSEAVVAAVIAASGENGAEFAHDFGVPCDAIDPDALDDLSGGRRECHRHLRQAPDRRRGRDSRGRHGTS